MIDDKPLIERLGADGWWFWCPGCEEGHRFGPQWAMSGPPDAPTFRPSLVTPDVSGATRCHLFVDDGHITYLKDCQHALAGQSVPMVPIESVSP